MPSGEDVAFQNPPQPEFRGRVIRAYDVSRGQVLVDGVKQCELAQDYVSREILTEILVDTEDHIDFLETQIVLLRTLGEQNYLQSAMGELGES